MKLKMPEDLSHSFVKIPFDIWMPAMQSANVGEFGKCGPVLYHVICLDITLHHSQTGKD